MATGTPAVDGGTGTRIWDVKIQWQHGTSKHQTGFSLRALAVFAGTDLDVATNVDTALRAAIRGVLPNTDTYLGVDAVDVGTKLGGTVSPASVVGLSSGAQGPSYNAAVVVLKGEQRTRRGQGRLFLPAYFEGQVDGDVLSTTGQTDMNVFVTALADTYISGGVGQIFRLVNWHRAMAADRPHKRPGTLPAYPATWYDVASARLNPQVTALRSRKAGVGS